MNNETSNKLSTQCDEIVCSYSLLEHPFYQAWSMGTLPVEALKSYAGEYGAFIETIGEGWASLGKGDIARHEQGHAKLWNDSFAAALATSVKEPNVGEVVDLVNKASDLFADKAKAIGALYAFEVQQPRTAESKLKGLKDHYTAIPDSAGAYFRLHSGDYDEVSILTEMMDGLSETESAVAAESCRTMAKALYDALSGIYEPYCVEC